MEGERKAVRPREYLRSVFIDAGDASGTPRDSAELLADLCSERLLATESSIRTGNGRAFTYATDFVEHLERSQGNRHVSVALAGASDMIVLTGVFYRHVWHRESRWKAPAFEYYLAWGRTFLQSAAEGGSHSRTDLLEAGRMLPSYVQGLRLHPVMRRNFGSRTLDHLAEDAMTDKLLTEKFGVRIEPIEEWYGSCYREPKLDAA